jgi:pyruvate kinase
MKTDLMVTLWPTFPHFERFVNDPRLSGVRMNTAKISVDQLQQDLTIFSHDAVPLPLWFDIKGRQLRIAELVPNLGKPPDVILNHPILVDTPTEILFKAGNDHAEIESILKDGKCLKLRNGPFYNIEVGESVHILNPHLRVFGNLFTRYEKEKIEKARQVGFRRFFLSYVGDQKDVDEFRELVGHDSEILLKIENKRGLRYVADVFRKEANIRLTAARGDLYVEIDKPHNILSALELIVEKDPEACVASRMLLSAVNQTKNEKISEALTLLKSEAFLGIDPQDRKKIITVVTSFVNNDIPSCADFCELAWLYDIGYRSFMLCDEICLKEKLLALAINIFDAFRNSYC